MNTPTEEIVCSFCGLTRDRVDVMLHASGKAYICDQCVDLAAEIVAASRHQKKIKRRTMVSEVANFPYGSLGKEIS